MVSEKFCALSHIAPDHSGDKQSAGKTIDSKFHGLPIMILLTILGLSGKIARHGRPE